MPGMRVPGKRTEVSRNMSGICLFTARRRKSTQTEDKGTIVVKLGVKNGVIVP